MKIYLYSDLFNPIHSYSIGININSRNIDIDTQSTKGIKDIKNVKNVKESNILPIPIVKIVKQ